MHVLLLLSQACPLLICASFLHVRTTLIAGVPTPNTSEISVKAKTSKRMNRGKEVKVEDKMGIHRTDGVKDKGKDDKLRILSIDGGGVRGVIPAAILKHLEQRLRFEEQQLENEKDKQNVTRLADYFDLIVGTSTGGLITAMITTTPPGDDPTKPPLSAEQVLEFYGKNSARIFPPARGRLHKTWDDIRELLLRPKYSPKQLYILLGEFCGDRKLSEARTNVIIPSFDIESQEPVFFSSWERPRFENILVKDVCRATTAAPTFLPPVYFTGGRNVPPTEDTDAMSDTEVRATPPSWDDEDKREEIEKTKVDDAQTGAENKPTHQFNMIDGGIAANNPTFVGITRAIRHLSWSNPGKEPPNQSYFKNLLVLSLGTGRHRTGYRAKDAKKWGVRKWLRHDGDTPLISSLQNASADIVDYNLSIVFGAHGSSENYLRIQTDIPEDSSALGQLDNAKKGNLEALEKLEEELLQKRVSEVDFNTGNMVRDSEDNDTFKDALNGFAKDLVSLRKNYPGKVRFTESSRAGGERHSEPGKFNFWRQ